MIKTIQLACDTKDHLPLEDLEPFQGDLKSLSATEFAKLKGHILKTGFAFPIYVWKSPEGINYILGGHQRVRVLTSLKKEGYVIPSLPVVFIQAASVQDAKKRVLQDVAQFGQVENQGLYEFMTEAGISILDLQQDFKLPDLDMTAFGDEFFDLDLNPGEEEQYSREIAAPIYEITGEKPKVASLFDSSKTDQLTARIQSQDLPDDVRQFLLFAAQRHTVFNFQRIAEFYAHQPKAIQSLMEDSALVIIDFNKAIENGFVKLSKDLLEQSSEE